MFLKNGLPIIGVDAKPTKVVYIGRSPNGKAIVLKNSVLVFYPLFIPMQTALHMTATSCRKLIGSNPIANSCWSGAENQAGA